MGSVKLLYYLVIMVIANSIPSFGNSLNRKKYFNPVFDQVFDQKPIDIGPFYNQHSDNHQNDYQDLKLELSKHFSKPQQLSNRIERYLEENNVVCEVQITKGFFEEEGYDIYPSEFLNKTCVSSNGDPYKSESYSTQGKPEMCLHNDNDFGCKTVYEEIRVMKRHKRKYDCWDYSTATIGIGCRCRIRFTYD